MRNITSDDDGSHTTAERSGDRPRSTDGGDPGLILTGPGLLAVVVVFYDLLKQSRQTELTEFESYK